MSKKKVRDYKEPWFASKDTTWQGSYRNPPVLSEYVDQDKVNAWHAARDAAEEAAHYFLWGSRMQEPDVAFDAHGGFKIWDGRGIIAFTRNANRMPGSPSHGEIAQRTVECVNACRGIPAPEKLIEDVRGLLLDLVQETAGPDDPRILSCLARMIPAEETHNPETE